MSDGHCRHCDGDCVPYGGVWDHHTPDTGATAGPGAAFVLWMDGKCPMCAAERHARSICQQQAVRAIEAADLTGNWAGALIGLHSLIRSSEWDDLTSPILADLGDGDE